MKKKREILFPFGDEMRLQFRKMKLTAILLFIVCVTFGNSFSQVRLSVRFNQTDIRDALQTIEDKTDYIFLYKDNIFDFSKKVSAEFTDAKFEEVLNTFCQQANVSYEIRDRQILLIEKEATPLLTDQTWQQKMVSGKVTDSSGASVPGVSVVVKGTTTGTITDGEGNYSLSNIPENAILQFSFVGMKMQEMPISEKTIIDVVMAEDAIGIEEVVAIGYGSAKKKDLTGSVVSMNSEAIQSVPVTSISEAMSGRLAGVSVTKPEGNPDAEIIIRIRGGGSITNDNSPLYIVDGFPVSSISDIPPSDIESIDVLKDASSTAIYGSRGSNGIILITTKNGKKGKLTINYDAYYGVKKTAQKVDILDPYDYALWQYELTSLRGVRNDFTEIFGDFENLPQYKSVKGYDWQDKVYGRTGTSLNNSLSISGGSDKAKFSASYGNINDKAILAMSDFKRNSLNLRFSYSPNEKLTFDFSTRYANTEVNGDGMSTNTGAPDAEPSNSFGRIKHAVIQMPFEFSAIGQGIDIDELDSGVTDPMTSLSDNFKKRDRTNYNMNGSVAWEILKGLKIRSEFGLDEFRNNLKSYNGPTTSESQANAQAQYLGMPLVQTSAVFSQTIRNANTIHYQMDDVLGGKNHMSILLGEETVNMVTDSETARYEGLPDFFDADIAFRFSAEGDPVQYRKFYYPDDKLLSFFGRLSYDYSGKYLLTATFRADGSSKFTQNNRWGYFPSVAVAWRLSDEPFMKNLNWLDNLKIRLSNGVAGNNNIPSGQTMKTFSVADQKAWLNISPTWWTTGKTLNNENLKWESTHSLNLGLDFAVFKGRFNGSLELYENNTKDLLIEFTLPGSSGYSTQYQNMGETQNRGFEATLNFIPINKKDYGLDFSFVIGCNRNKIISLGSLESYTKATSWQNTEVGADYIIQKDNPVGMMIGFVTDGRYEVSDFEEYNGSTWILKEGVANNTDVLGAEAVRPGGLKLKDLDGSGAVNESDKEIIGNANPLSTGGFTISARVKSFDLSANFHWSYGNDIYNADKIEFTSPSKYNFRNMSTIMESGERWTNLSSTGEIINDPALLAEMNKSTTMWSPFMKKSVFHSWAIEDGSFLRLNTLSLGYTMPKSITGKYSIDRLRFYTSIYNVFCLTNYSGLDPEVDTRRNYRVTPGVDFSAYPKSRQVVFGINLSF